MASAQTATGWRCKVREAAEERFTPVHFIKEERVVSIVNVGYFIVGIIFIGIVVLIILMLVDIMREKHE